MTKTHEIDTLLPPGFETLEPFVGYWARKTTNERWDQRARAPMSEITAFYDAMYASAEDAIAWLDARTIDNAAMLIAISWLARHHESLRRRWLQPA